MSDYASEIVERLKNEWLRGQGATTNPELIRELIGTVGEELEVLRHYGDEDRIAFAEFKLGVLESRLPVQEEPVESEGPVEEPVEPEGNE